jgi:bacterioferritin (cytochrome b1)
MTKDIIEQLGETTNEMLQLVSSFNEDEMNSMPFKDSWTAAQVAEHVTKSNASMIRSLSEEGKTSSRNIDEGVQKLKEIFLDFTSKLKSPKFILPTRNSYSKEIVVADLKNSIEQIKKLSNTINLSEIVNHRVFGEITKFEILHFVVYHTERHIHQLKNIFQKVKNNSIESV